MKSMGLALAIALGIWCAKTSRIPTVRASAEQSVEHPRVILTLQSEGGRLAGRMVLRGPTDAGAERAALDLDVDDLDFDGEVLWLTLRTRNRTPAELLSASHRPATLATRASLR